MSTVLSRSVPQEIGKESHVEAIGSMLVLFFVIGTMCIVGPISDSGRSSFYSLGDQAFICAGIITILICICLSVYFYRRNKQRVLFNRSLPLGINEPAPGNFRALFAGSIYKDGSCDKPACVELVCSEYRLDTYYNTWRYLGPFDSDDLTGLVTPVEVPVDADAKTVAAAFESFQAEVAHENRCRLDGLKAASDFPCVSLVTE